MKTAMRKNQKKELSKAEKQLIDRAAKKIVKNYGKTLQLLAKE